MTDKLNLQRLDHDPRLPMRGSIDFERVLYVRLYELFRAIAGVTNQNGEAISDAISNVTTQLTEDINQAIAGVTNQIDSKASKSANLSDLTDASTARNNLGLGNVDNTSDLNKPISTDTQAALDLKVDKANNLSDLADAATARSNLGLGNAATTNVGTSSGNVMEVGAFGLGGPRKENDNSLVTRFAYYATNNQPPGYPSEWYGYGVLWSIYHGYSGDVAEFIVSHTNNPTFAFRPSRNYPWREIRHTGNTTVDGNGFIKRASPIIKLFSDSIEKTEHLEIAEAELERLGAGHYVLHNTPLLSREGWYIETPKDRNNNIYFYLDYEENETDKTLTIKTYEPDYSTGRVTAGEPVDILEGRFVSLRFEEDASLYVEQEIGND